MGAVPVRMRSGVPPSLVCVCPCPPNSPQNHPDGKCPPIITLKSPRRGYFNPKNGCFSPKMARKWPKSAQKWSNRAKLRSKNAKSCKIAIQNVQIVQNCNISGCFRVFWHQFHRYSCVLEMNIGMMWVATGFRGAIFTEHFFGNVSLSCEVVFIQNV